MAKRLNSSCSDLTIVSLDAEDSEKHGGPNLVNKQRVLPFIPPSFPVIKGPLFVPRGAFQKVKIRSTSWKTKKDPVIPGPPPPPLPEFVNGESTANNSRQDQNTETRKQNQPLSAISIQDLNSVQLRRTDKMIASKTFSAPTRSMSLQCLQSEPYLAQKTDLIAELKMSRDITGIKKMKIERAKTEEYKEKEIFSEISKQFTTTRFVEKQKKAAEKARKELEEQLQREAEEKRLQSIPQWKRQLIMKKEEAEHRMRATLYTPKVIDEPKVNKLHDTNECLRQNGQNGREAKRNEDINNNDDSEKFENENDYNDNEQSDEEPPNIIPWRAQLRKTNSKLNLLD
ncbi:hypothetical protein NQ314_001046 [Rhamnusium bicolor]|uniref:Uncharacterized protein n=1 Tax=Rhamnusium bicolor TaxID=1586634 RepID=A0AAV8ZV14_9CUCU|nr:hypothetical protein NQ314_001046 [Rhamnusium bicolor]